MKRAFGVFLGLLSLLIVATPAFALGQDWGGCVVDGVPTLQCLPVVFQNIVTAAVVLAGVVAVVLIVLSGIKLITSGGDPKQVEGARKTMTYAIIGLVLILLSFFIIKLIGFITGVECINQFGFDTCQ